MQMIPPFFVLVYPFQPVSFCILTDELQNLKCFLWKGLAGNIAPVEVLGAGKLSNLKKMLFTNFPLR